MNELISCIKWLFNYPFTRIRIGQVWVYTFQESNPFQPSEAVYKTVVEYRQGFIKYSARYSNGTILPDFQVMARRYFLLCASLVNMPLNPLQIPDTNPFIMSEESVPVVTETPVETIPPSDPPSPPSTADAVRSVIASVCASIAVHCNSTEKVIADEVVSSAKIILADILTSKEIAHLETVLGIIQAAPAPVKAIPAQPDPADTTPVDAPAPAGPPAPYSPVNTQQNEPTFNGTPANEPAESV